MFAPTQRASGSRFVDRMWGPGRQSGLTVELLTAVSLEFGSRGPPVPSPETAHILHVPVPVCDPCSPHGTLTCNCRGLNTVEGNASHAAD